MKTYELFGAALDWAVAKCEGLDYWQPEIGPSQPDYSTDWSQGGPIIEREKISIALDEEEPWCAFKEEDTDIQSFYSGPTPLIAAMRCYVASKLGDEVDVPEELNTV
jgi:hypothetical protein